MFSHFSRGASVNTNGTDGGKQIGLPPISMIERIEVIRGPMSSLYGSDAMGGIINIITKKSTGEWAGNINTEWTHSLNDVNNDTQKVDLMTGGASVESLLGLQVTGSWIGTDESDFQANSVKSDGSTPEGKNKEIGTKLILTPNDNNDISLSYNKATREYTHTLGKSLLLQEADKLRSEYEQGISCHHCIDEYTKEQRERFRERERQIQLAKQRGESHIGDEQAQIIEKRRAEKQAFKEAQRTNA